MEICTINASNAHYSCRCLVMHHVRVSKYAAFLVCTAVIMVLLPAVER